MQPCNKEKNGLCKRRYLMEKVEKKLQDMGIIIPGVPKPAASYVPAV